MSTRFPFHLAQPAVAQWKTMQIRNFYPSEMDRLFFPLDLEAYMAESAAL